MSKKYFCEDCDRKVEVTTNRYTAGSWFATALATMLFPPFGVLMFILGLIVLLFPTKSCYICNTKLTRKDKI